MATPLNDVLAEIARAIQAEDAAVSVIVELKNQAVDLVEVRSAVGDLSAATDRLSAALALTAPAPPPSPVEPS